MNFIITALASIGTFVAEFGSQACIYFWLDEPKCPRTLIK